MAAASLLALLDDIIVLLDDAALIAKVAAKKSAGVLGDDLALNAHQVSGSPAHRELPIVWAVAKGSLLNKVILVPCALLISVIAPWAIAPLLMLGGLYLCYEGVEKVSHALFRSTHDQPGMPAPSRQAPASSETAAIEKERVKGAIRTDFVLSAEIIVIALGAAANAPLAQKAMALGGVALLMTVFVYGLVAAIVRLDDLGFWLIAKPQAAAKTAGSWIVKAAPGLMRLLAIAGTAAMFIVGGGILTHEIPAAHAFLDSASRFAEQAPLAGPVLGWLSAPALNALAGALAGSLALALVNAAKRLNPFKPRF